MAARGRKFYVDLLRVILALVFIFSGFVKAVDPWGTAIKLGEYFDAFGMEWLQWAEYALSILLSGFELLLGLLLLFNLKVKLASFFTMVFMIFFTILTLISALYEPVTDCGCFGDALKLTNWQTFYKNVVLLGMSLLLFGGVAKEVRRFNIRGEIAIVFALAAVAFATGVYSQLHVPIIEFLPYRVGVNIPSKMAVPDGAPQGEYRTTLLYRNIETGDVHEFEVEDTTWYDTLRWAFVDTRSQEITRGYVPEITDFAIFRGGHDFTDAVLDGEDYLFVFERLDYLTAKDYEKVANTLAFAGQGGAEVCYVTSSPLGADPFARRGIHLEGYNMDATAMKSLIRAHKGLVLLRDGTVMAKWNIRDVPDFATSGAWDATGYVVERGVMRSGGNFFKLLAVIVIFLAFVRVRLCVKY